MTRVMDTIKQELEKATTWLSTNDVMQVTGRSRGSVGRALRRLADRQEVTKKVIALARPRHMQWATPRNAADPLFLYAVAPGMPSKLKKTSKATKSQRVPQLHIIPSNSTQGGLIMQIEQGVETIVSKLVQDQIKFSAHDVTAELRKQVNDGTLQVDPGLAGEVFVQSLNKKVTKIEHPIVRDAVHQLMTSGKYDYDRVHNGSFFEYAPKADDSDPTNPGTPQTPPVSSAPYDGSSSL